VTAITRENISANAQFYHFAGARQVARAGRLSSYDDSLSFAVSQSTFHSKSPCQSPTPYEMIRSLDGHIARRALCDHNVTRWQRPSP